MTLDDLRNIAENATAGEWRCETYVSVDGRVHLVKADGCQHVLSSLNMSEEDAEFIETFNPQRVLEMIAEIVHLQEQVETREKIIADGSITYFELEARLAAVEKLHQPAPVYGDNGEIVAQHCTKCEPDPGATQNYWPCDDIKAVRGE